MQTDDLPGDTAVLRAAGTDVGDPEKRDRTRPDGKEIRWVFSLSRGASRGVAPFIIADETGRDERVPRERSHANGIIGIGTLTVAVHDVAGLRRWYAAVTKQPGADIMRADLAGAGGRFVFRPHTLASVPPT